MSDVDIVLGTLPRIQFACRVREVGGERAGTITAHQARILSHLDAVDPTMVTELAEFMGVTASTMSLNLKRLREAGLVSSHRDPEDRRVMNVRLTDAGGRMRDSLTELDIGRVDAMLRRLRPEDRARALRGLTLLAEAADALVAVGSPGGSVRAGSVEP
jgi:DNA-binding MarR family transcriptional regulator